MNPPPVYDAEGKEYSDRRHEHRRDDDLDPEQIRGYDFWLRLMFLHKGKIIALCSALFGVSGYMLGVFGLSARVSKLEVVANANRAAISALQENDHFKTYLLCVIVRKIDPVAVPPDCGPIILTRTP